MMPQIVFLLTSNSLVPTGRLNCHCQHGQTAAQHDAGGTYWGAWPQSLIRVETHCLPSCSLHLGRTLWPWATKSKSQGWRIKPTHIPECGFVQPQGADITEPCLTFRFPKSLGCFVYFFEGLTLALKALQDPLGVLMIQKVKSYRSWKYTWCFGCFEMTVTGTLETFRHLGS